MFVVPKANKYSSPVGATCSGPFADDAAPERSLGVLWGGDATNISLLWSFSCGGQGTDTPHLLYLRVLGVKELVLIRAIRVKHPEFFRPCQAVPTLCQPVPAVVNPCQAPLPPTPCFPACSYSRIWRPFPHLTAPGRPETDRFKAMQGKKLRVRDASPSRDTRH